MPNTTYPVTGKSDLPSNVKKTKVPEFVPSAVLIEMSLRLKYVRDLIKVLHAQVCPSDRLKMKDLEASINDLTVLVIRNCTSDID